jgi:predicted adenine nucleotide alpha hydrolase (AANH) superfamily ATPase
MKLLIHICCSPCLCYPYRVLTEAGHELTGYWYNPNIHPTTEYVARLDSLLAFARGQKLPLVLDNQYRLEDYLQAVSFEEEDRCRICYDLRLRQAAQVAKAKGADAFSTTLLYSIYQKHDLLAELGARIGEETGVPFFYQDFRPGWKEGIRKSKEIGLYRQKYCGCIYSERERYASAEP